jgi:four helix bundle protein
MTYKFQRLEIYQLALDYIDLIYAVCEKLPRSEDFGLRSQITRAANSIALNIAEGSTSQSDPEQTRFLGIGLRSLIETVACMDIIERRKYLTQEELQPARELAGKLFAKIQAMRKSLCSVSVGTNSALQRSSVAGRRS